MLEDVGELPPCPRVICIPRLCDTGVGSLNLPDEGEDPNDICNHGKGVPLGHTLLAKKEVALPVPRVPYHQRGPVAVAVNFIIK